MPLQEKEMTSEFSNFRIKEINIFTHPHVLLPTHRALEELLGAALLNFYIANKQFPYWGS